VKVEDEFRRRYHDVDALVFAPLWDTWRHLAGNRPMRANIELALDRLQAKAEVGAKFGARRSEVPPPPAAVPHLVPPAS
jgi:hypothetical protein